MSGLALESSYVAVFRESAATRPFWKRAWYGFLFVMCRTYAAAFFHVRVGGASHLPSTGPVLVLSNHQSHLDPILIGLACERRLNFVARKSLFRFAPFRMLIQSLDAIPIDRDGMGADGIKTTLRRLKAGECVLLFPEGTRTRDGSVGKVRPGFAAVAKRARVPIAPVALDGAFDAWPRTNLLPRWSTISIEFCPAITPEEINAMSESELVAEAERRIRQCHARARNKRLKRLDQPPSAPTGPFA